MNGIFFSTQINNEDVRQASHETVVNLIRKSGDLVSLTVVTVLPQFLSPHQQQPAGTETASASASPSMSLVSAGNAAAVQSGRQYSTLPRKLHTSGKALSAVQPPPPPKRNPTTTLSIGKARARSMVANLSAIGQFVSRLLLRSTSFPFVRLSMSCIIF